ncbi:alpha/beta hydrolase [Anoxybacteroides tepidamans]|uniref:alpha/beta hydrolase n=1 Tax=Anoxybacteroides tepidamans TaxID=265948 RepID=UPI000488F6DF|nr:alpha/beta fold hydrolase [Anoxybacillus tepidamans]
MQKAVELKHRGMVLRGMEHIPDRMEEGKVPALILFHGFTGTKLEPHRLFLKISRALERQNIASFRFDFLGSGESDGNFEDMTLSKEIEEAHAIIDFVKKDQRIDTSRIYLLGLSMGGLVASVVAGDRPADIIKLVLLAPPGNMYELIKQTAAQTSIDVTAPYHDHGGNLVGRAFLEDLQTIDAFERAKPYQGPVLLIHGTNDEVVPCYVSNMYRERCYGEQANVHFIAGANHTFDGHKWEEELIEAVVQFLTECI